MKAEAMEKEAQQCLKMKDRGQEKKAVVGLQKIFRNICLILLMILIFCVPGFLKFRDHCEERGYHVLSSNSFIFCGLGFLIVMTAKYGYSALMKTQIQKILNPSYEEETLKKKTKFALKLSYDTIFYTISTVCSYLIFNQEYWYPVSVGGSGACSNLYKEYPNWPSGKYTELEAYFCFQLGVHFYSIFELGVLRTNDHKYYEMMLHHFMAASLILFSIMSNQIAAGVMILIVHDASDIFMAGCRLYFEAYIPKKKAITGFLVFMLFFSWIYLRIIIFPICLLSNVYINKPTPSDEWYIIRWEYLYLLSMAFVLFGMHIYWTYCLIKSALISLNSKQVVNDFDNSDKKK